MSPPPHDPDVTRRGLILALAASPLAACEAPYGLDYKTIGQSLAVSIGIESPPGITIEQAGQVPYSSLGYRLGDSAEQMLVLGTASDNANLWTSAERRALSTKAGRITKTAGFKWNLSETYWPAPDPLSEGAAASSRSTLRLLDFGDVKRFGARLHGQFDSARESEITILGTSIPTISLSEICHCEDFDWDFQNQFWLDRQSGFVWRSVQYVHPNLEPFTIEVFRPPG